MAIAEHWKCGAANLQLWASGVWFGWVQMFNAIFPAERLRTLDYIIAVAFSSLCFVLFLHSDLQGTGWCSVNYLYGSPLELYENCQRGHGDFYANYLPTIYIVFSLWLYPLKLLGLLSGPEQFPLYMAYWLKTLTTIAYVMSGVVFYRIALNYVPDNSRARYSVAMWLTTPMAFFSQFIFSQYDIFYVLPTLAGILLFLRGRSYAASAIFSVAITVKYFPIFVFLPLLLLNEKRFWRIFICCLILVGPAVASNFIYNSSSAFIAGVRHYVLLERIYESSFSVGYAGYWRVYVLPALFVVLCGLAYFSDVSGAARSRQVAYVWLVASILPFAFIFWHPQWLMFPAAAIALTSAISGGGAKFMLLDLFGMVFFVATTALTFQGGVDATMVRGELFGAAFDNSFPMERLFSWFGDHSRNVFLSCLWGYFLLQICLKWRLLIPDEERHYLVSQDYTHIRCRLYVGLSIFLLPAAASFYNSSPKSRWAFFEDSHATLSVAEYPLLRTGSLEQTFVASGNLLAQVSLAFAPVGVLRSDVISLEILDARGNRLRKIDRRFEVSDDGLWQSWKEFAFDPIPVSRSDHYRLRLTSLSGTPEGAFGLAAAPNDSYKDGEAVIDGVPQKWDFLFRLGFVR
jgi:hypothetical protein